MLKLLLVKEKNRKQISSLTCVKMKEKKELGAMVKVPCYNSSWIRRKSGNKFPDVPLLGFYRH